MLELRVGLGRSQSMIFEFGIAAGGLGEFAAYW
jgi:hypothetical protein